MTPAIESFKHTIQSLDDAVRSQRDELSAAATTGRDRTTKQRQMGHRRRRDEPHGSLEQGLDRGSERRANPTCPQKEEE